MSFATARFLLLSLLVSLAAAGLFSLGIGGPFVLDDAHAIVDNTLIRLQTLDYDTLMYAASSFHDGSGLRPLSMLSFGFDYWRHGSLDAATFKATNLFIHALTTFFLAVFIRRLLMLAQWTPRPAAIAALLVALVWAIHPLQVSSVLYVVQRMQTLATLFLVPALWCYLRLRLAQIEGRPGWPFGVLGTACWGLALACKEDAILLPLYLLVLELTVLRFRAASVARSRGLRATYLAIVGAGALLFLFWALPTFWSSEAYGGRDFNSTERLLTQGRVLMMYLGQILVPLPSRMPFNYDELVVSRSLLQPATTLPSLLAIAGLLSWAWAWRRRRPVFSFGVLLFFAGHLLTSSIVPLELAFEHRNHLPLIGVLLALADLIEAGWQRWGSRPLLPASLLTSAMLLVAVAGGIRAHAWGDPIRFAKHNLENSPTSPRAWLALGGVYFDLAGRKEGRGNPYLDLAIATVEEGAAKTGSPSAYANIVIYKTIDGTVEQADWDRLLQRLEEAPMAPATKAILWTCFANVRAGIGLDKDQVLRVVATVTRRAGLSPLEHLKIAGLVYRDISQPEALPYMLLAARASPPGDSSIVAMKDELVKQGHADWAMAVERANAEGLAP
ncbi:hypothetical protein MMG85_05330 [Pseudoxanthomonas sp. LH2527]|uniref:hypothetical protein n=1 Tax=Pseudoxanthomonas sp. LH2527 TaxID=2923249 RepID=UPI001F12FB7F|nr:hypothetical protein [Pseudoxanthomonas sp. LH2527]MCH6482984.1 hypothetical protein [Pseudoxanthomonas sp. LH2527]